MISESFTSVRAAAIASGIFGRQLWFSSRARHWMVSSFGRCKTSAGRITLGWLTSSGYRRVNICGQSFYVHRVVAHSFLGLPPDDETWQVHHRDGNHANNRLDNLEYVTQSENTQHSYTTNPQRAFGGCTQSKPVMWRPTYSQDWTTFPSLSGAARTLGMSRKTVARLCRDGLQAGDSDFKFGELSERPVLPSEEWARLLNPTTGLQIPGRWVSSLGRIVSYQGIISRGYQRRSGYVETSIMGKKFFVHRLVARAFLGPPPSPKHSQVNHKDWNPGNNNVDNLEYVTLAENMIHALSNLHIRQRHKEANSKPVFGRRLGSKDEWAWYPSMTAAAEAVGVRPSAVSQCLRRVSRRTRKYEFRLVTEDAPAEEIFGEEWRTVDLEELLEEKRQRYGRP